MPTLHHTFVLTDVEIKKLKDIIHKGAKETARTIMHAHILLMSNDSELNEKKMTNKEILKHMYSQWQLVRRQKSGLVGL